ncbi:hypothetical protein Hamer_G003502 [Homarus americanus]|uniref:Uncharacterized protein n=1 Tax=Homarus americanus TaxID=6706 RepID=A0A8J5MUA3_HOMAM|nr:hypothetical protein Hamer_G003502 [Homarus americanus]
MWQEIYGKKRWWCCCVLMLATLVHVLIFVWHSHPSPVSQVVSTGHYLIASLPYRREDSTVSSKNTKKSLVLSQRCYLYTGITAHNTCCKMLDYTMNNGSNILECAKNHRLQFSRNFRRGTTSAQTEETALTPGGEATAGGRGGGAAGVYWVMVGDSHIRNVFDVLVSRIRGPRLQYRFANDTEVGYCLTAG